MALKSDILTVLEHERGNFVSGQDLAERFQVSRAAVCKVIKTLIAEKNDIIAVTNQGYCLQKGSDALTKEGILAHLDGIYRGTEVEILRTVDSTNNELKRRHAQSSDFVLFAEEQTAGRGRSGKSFFSPPYTSLYMSFLLTPSKIKLKTGLITTAAAVAISRAIATVAHIETQIKWVNDLFYKDKKICGILTEAVTSLESGEVESIILGIGINCNLVEEDISEELKEIVGSLKMTAPRNLLAAECIQSVLKELYTSVPSGILEYAEAHSYLLGKKITYRSGTEEKEGIARSLNQDGHLIVELRDGTTETLVAGLVSVKMETK